MRNIARYFISYPISRNAIPRVSHPIIADMLHSSIHRSSISASPFAVSNLDPSALPNTCPSAQASTSHSSSSSTSYPPTSVACASDSTSPSHPAHSPAAPPAPDAASLSPSPARIHSRLHTSAGVCLLLCATRSVDDCCAASGATGASGVMHRCGGAAVLAQAGGAR